MHDVVGLDEVDRTWVGEVGGKGAQLGELRRVGGVPVPDGFCVTTAVYRRAVAGRPGFDDLLDRLAAVAPDDHLTVRTLSAQVRGLIEAVTVPEETVDRIGTLLARLGADGAYAVRSSATAEDLPTASFAGQQDSFLDVVGLPAVLAHVTRCWASLFTERAVAYRVRQGFDHRAVSMAVVVERMVAADAAGVLFTADPVTSHRRVATVEAVRGLGEALVSGRARPDRHAVRDGVVVASSPADPAHPVLTDAQVLRLVHLGRRLEAHLGQPQDVEWCLRDDEFSVVQSRAITTLFPVPDAPDDDGHVYLSVGHQQMMTDAMTPLGLSVWQRGTPRPMAEAGSRLFVDVGRQLATASGRSALLATIGRSDPLTVDALQTLIDRGDPVADRPDDPPAAAPPPAAEPLPTDPAVVADLVAASEASVAALAERLAPLTGVALLDAVAADFAELRRLLFAPSGIAVITAGMQATWWLTDHLGEWLDEPEAADALARSAPHNVTSEMGLALLEVADVVRPHPEVVAYLQRVVATAPTDAAFLHDLGGLPGGAAARGAIEDFLAAYGMRGAGEIDLGRPRFGERPATLLPTVLGHVAAFGPGEGRRRFEQGERHAQATAERVLARVHDLPDGAAKATELAAAIERVRTFVGYREYPKFAKIHREFVYKRALLAEAARLVHDGVLAAPDDVFFLRFDELHETVRSRRVDRELIAQRRADLRAHQALRPPRVLTSDGETLDGSHRRADVPPGALVGLAVSAGTVEGRARVVVDLARADLQPGDILVTVATDPSWTPLFVTAAGLVTEVGGLMTHGAVVAREYGLPAVVGVHDATRLIRDGQRIRLHATAGYAEPLD